MVTSTFQHTGLIQFVSNTAYLLAFGAKLEGRLRPFRFLLFYLLSGLAATSIQIIISPASRIPSVGASGAIASVLAGYLVLFPEGVVRVFLFAGPYTRSGWAPALLFVALWFVLQFLSGIASLGVTTAGVAGTGYWAHLGGFAAGLVFALMYRQFWEQPPRAPKE